MCSGYMAPEYLMHGNLSIKSDVFSYGVLVLELVSGHRNSTFSLQMEAQSLLDWVRIQIIMINNIIDYLTWGLRLGI